MSKIVAAIVAVGITVCLPAKQTDLGDDEYFLENVEKDYWFEPGSKLSARAFSVFGPEILRKRDGTVFIWQRNYFDLKGKDLAEPYLLVLVDVNSMELLSSFSNQYSDTDRRIVSGGSIQSKGLAFGFSYSISAGLGVDVPETLKERMEFWRDDGSTDFDLANGRVFVISKDPGSGKYKLKQERWELPSAGVFKPLRTMLKDRAECHKRLEDWIKKSQLDKPDD